MDVYVFYKCVAPVQYARQKSLVIVSDYKQIEKNGVFN
jgi:hypothetical protein